MKLLGTSFSAALVIGAAVAFAPLAAAGDGAAAITERQALMKLQGAAFVALKSAVDSKDPARIKAAEGTARALAFSSTAIPTMFPKGSDEKAGRTAALAKVWEDGAGFKAAADKMGGLATKLADTLKGGDPAAAAAAFGELGKDGCGGCHGTFRAKQN